MAMAGRKLGPDGELELTDGMEQFLDWLTGARPEGETQHAFGERLGVSDSTLRNWKKDRSFLRRWEDRMRESHAHPDVLSRQLEVLNEKALAGDVRATELYWRLVDRMSPERVEHVDSGGVKTLTDDELNAEIARQAAKEREDRRLRAVE